MPTLFQGCLEDTDNKNKAFNKQHSTNYSSYYYLHFTKGKNMAEKYDILSTTPHRHLKEKIVSTISFHKYFIASQILGTWAGNVIYFSISEILFPSWWNAFKNFNKDNTALQQRLSVKEVSFPKPKKKKKIDISQCPGEVA